MEKPREILLSKQVYEKNFVPFNHDQELLFAYAVEPHEVYTLDQRTGEADLVASSSNKLLRQAMGRADIWIHGGAFLLTYHCAASSHARGAALDFLHFS